MSTYSEGFTLTKLDNGEIDIDSALRQVDLFEGLPREALREIASHTKTFYAYSGQTVIEEGDASHEVFIILRGKVKVQVESITPYVEVGITRLDSGQVIGEMAILGDSPRSATVVTLEPSELARIPADTLRMLADRNSDWGIILMRNLAQILGSRLRCMNRRMLNYVRARYY